MRKFCKPILRSSKLKRLFDLVGASLMLVLLALPVMLPIALLVRWKLGAPVLFRQSRAGLHGKPFTLYKFRTMTDDRDSSGNLLPDSDRLTAFGCFLRSSSLDELPELWNVLKGEMSFVGPRPLLVEYLDYYTPDQARRHLVKPGLTGWAQINGRNALSWGERFKLDVYYVDNWDLLLDMRILLLTFVAVFQRRGISAQGHVSMPKFTDVSHG